MKTIIVCLSFLGVFRRSSCLRCCRRPDCKLQPPYQLLTKLSSSQQLELPSQPQLCILSEPAQPPTPLSQPLLDAMPTLPSLHALPPLTACPHFIPTVPPPSPPRYPHQSHCSPHPHCIRYQHHPQCSSSLATTHTANFARTMSLPILPPVALMAPSSYTALICPLHLLREQLRGMCYRRPTILLECM